MGYSASKEAFDTLDRINETLMSLFPCDSEHGIISNSWEIDKHKYFYEIGNEQSDGSITGAIYETDSNNMGYKKGGFKISEDGKIIRFPKLPKNVRSMIDNIYLANQCFKQGESFVIV